MRSKCLFRAWINLALRSTDLRISAAVLAAAASLAPVVAVGAPPTGRVAIYWASCPVKPGQVAMLSGWNLAGQPVRIARLPDYPAGTPVPPRLPGWAETAQPLQASVDTLKIMVPPGAPPGCYVGTVGAGRQAALFTLNCPSVWWSQGSLGLAATPGSWLHVLGNCLAIPGGKSTLMLTGPEGSITLQPTTASTFDLCFALPDSLKPGEYTARAHNGCGGPMAWSAPFEVQIGLPAREPKARETVLAAGADPTGAKDSTKAIQQTIDKLAAAGGGTVYFPRGRYQLTDGITVPPGITLAGDQPVDACLFWTMGEDGKQAALPPALVKGTHGFGIQDLDLYADDYRDGIVADTGDVPGAGHVDLERVVVRFDRYLGHLTSEEVNRRFKAAGSSGGDTLRLGGDDVTILDCDIYGSGRALALGFARGAYIARNRFYNGRWGWYNIYNSDGVIFRDNQITGADLMSTGGGLAVWGSHAPVRQENIFFANNVLRLMHGWDREAMTTDGGGGAYLGAAEAANGRDLTLADNPKWGSQPWAGAGVYILAGKGAGQYRMVESTNGRRIYLNAPFAVAPDATSVLSVTPLQRRYILVGNRFEDATVGIQFYGISIEHIAAGNISTRTGGFHGFGLVYDGYQPDWYVQFLNNTIEDGNGMKGPLNEYPPVDAHVAIMSAQTNPPLARWGILRGNVLKGNASLEVRSARDVVIEGNRVSRAHTGIILNSASRDCILRANQITRCDRAVEDLGVNTWTHPAERLRALAQTCMDAWGHPLPHRLLAEATRLAARPLSPELGQACRALQLRMWAAARHAGAPAHAAAGLIGLHWNLEHSSSALQLARTGDAGEGELITRVWSDPGAPAIRFTVDASMPGGWTLTTPADMVELQPGQSALLRTHVLVPAHTKAVSVLVRLIVQPAGADGVILHDAFVIVDRK